jgi:hypothetical protein
MGISTGLISNSLCSIFGLDSINYFNDDVSPSPHTKFSQKNTILLPVLILNVYLFSVIPIIEVLNFIYCVLI